MNKSLIKRLVSQSVLVILMITLSNTAVATTLADYLVEKNDKLSVMEGHAQALPQPQQSPKIAMVNQKAKKASPLARAMAQSSDKNVQQIQQTEKTLVLDISELRDSTGLVYLGGKVAEAELNLYLEQLEQELGAEQFAIYRQHQAARDHQSFHVTLVNPYEYQTINKEKLKSAQKFRVRLHGLGKVAKGSKSSFFVVASSPDGQFIRQNLLLKNKDFHVTLGFYPEDVFGVSKGPDTLINK